jgi:hypothetical protein
MQFNNIYKKFIEDESKKKKKNFILKYLTYSQDNYFKILFAISFNMFGLYFLKHNWKFEKKNVSWDKLKLLEFCKKDTEKKIDAIDFMTQGSRKVEDVYNFLQKNKKINNPIVKSYLKEMYKYNKKMPDWIIVNKDKKNNWWIIDGNHRMFWYLKNKIKNKNLKEIECYYLHKIRGIKNAI